MNLQHLATALKNKHVSVPVAGAIACEVGKVWFPDHKDKFDATQHILMSYGLIAASMTGAPEEKPPDQKSGQP